MNACYDAIKIINSFIQLLNQQTKNEQCAGCSGWVGGREGILPCTGGDPRTPPVFHTPLLGSFSIQCSILNGCSWVSYYNFAHFTLRYSHLRHSAVSHKKTKDRASLVAQWLRICLPMQGTRVRALVWEDPTCRGATGPVRHNYWACAFGACAPQQERPR